jgi:chromatin remodeling complex protein RSC6
MSKTDSKTDSKPVVEKKVKEVKPKEVKPKEEKKDEVKEEVKKEEVKKEEVKPKAEKVKKEKSESKEEKSEKPKKEKKEKSKKESSATDSAVVSQLAPSSSEDSEKVRRVVNNEEVEKSFDELHKTLEDELQLLRDNKNHSVGIRYLRNVARQLKLLKADCFRLLTRKVRKPSVRSGNSGFMKNVKISVDMAKFCNFKPDQLVSRVDVTKAICNYVKEKDLQNKADRRQFNPDEKLATLLGVKEMVTYYTLQKHIQKHFPKTA